VIFLEPKARYWPKEAGTLAFDAPGIGTGRVVRDGDGCLRSLSPLDLDLLERCVVETGRVVVVHEAPRTLGMGAEIAARVMELAFDHLEAPVARVTGWDVPYPPAALEQRYLPSVERIVEGARAVVTY
jgi:pyruvate dehydrogenase E1 component beta subunit